MRFAHWRWSLWLLLALALSLGFERRLGAANPKTLKRSEDPVIVTGKAMPGALGWPVAQTRLFAVKNGQARAVPFQVDEVKSNGKFALTYGPKRSTEDGLIDENDQLVFMVVDAGDQGGAESLPPGFDAAVELQLNDPVDGGRAWAYLARYPQNAPPLSPLDYVRFDNARTRVDTSRYAMGFHPRATMSIGLLATKPAGGGTGENVVDRLKIRASAEIRGGLGLVERNEEEFFSQTIGWIDGPVRVIRSTSNQVRAIATIKSPSAYLDNIYYFNAFEFPLELFLPFNPGMLSNNPKVRVSTDGLCSLPPGNTFYNSRNLQGVTVDGAMSEAEQKLDLAPYEWSVVQDRNKKAAWINRLLYDHASPAKPLLYYRDDRTHAEPPEDEPGECGDIGYQLLYLDQVRRGRLTLTSVLYQSNNFSLGRVQEYMNILDQKLQVVTRAL